MYQYGGYCGGYQQAYAPVCGGNSCGLAIILVLFILLVIAGCGFNQGCGC
ncbi:MAG TPA: sporulation protein YjcZ [Firmicutes bacterium]|nr:sporulation protein YjcZ [Bacillota bacterium]